MKLQFCFFILVLSLVCCKHEPFEPTVFVEEKLIPLPDSFYYEKDTLLFEKGYSVQSGLSNIKDTSFKYTIRVSPDVDNKISISQNGEILVDSTLTIGTYWVSVFVQTKGANKEFKDVLALVCVDSIPKVKISYELHVKPIFQANCSPCHYDGAPRPNWLDYETAKFEIDFILDRTQRTPGSEGFMPNGGTSQIAQKDINTFIEWKKDGLLP